MSSKPSETPSANDTQPDVKTNRTKELLDVLASGVKPNKSKKAAKGDGEDAIMMEVYHIAGKKAVALLDPFAIPSVAFDTGIKHDSGEGIDETLDPKVIERHLHFYNGILKFIPSLRKDLDTISPSQFSKIINAITKGMSDARSTDLGSVKHKGLKYVPANMHDKSEALDPPIPDVVDKSMCGIFHPQLARFLCPRRYVEEFDEDLDLGMQALQAGEIPLKPSRWPTGFYDDAHSEHNEEDKTTGLFRNHVVVRFYKHLFLGPASSAADMTNDSSTRKASKPSKNRAWKLKSVDRHIIAYAHIITYITLSHAQQWTHLIGDSMDLEDLYWRIVEMLEDKSNPWVIETLKWWNKYCNPGSTPSTKANGDEASSGDDMAEVRAQKAVASKGKTSHSKKVDAVDTSVEAVNSGRKKSSAHVDEDVTDSEAAAPAPVAPVTKKSSNPKGPRKKCVDEDFFVTDSEAPVSAPVAPVTKIQSNSKGPRKKSSARIDGDVTDSEAVAPAPVTPVTKPKQSNLKSLAHIDKDMDVTDSEAPAPAPVAPVTKKSSNPKGPRKKSSVRIDKDVTDSEAAALAPVAPVTKKSSNPKGPRKKSSVRIDEDVTDSEAAAPTPVAPVTKKSSNPKGPRKKSSVCIDEDMDVTDLEAPAPAPVAPPAKPSAIQVDGDLSNGAAGSRDPVANSPLSQLSDDDDNDVENAQGSHVESSNPTKRCIKLTLKLPSAATEVDDDMALPPQKKRKKASTRPSTTPVKRNPARGRRANGF